MSVFVSGCFDRLHPGHIRFLRSAAQFGNLAVSVGSDATIRQLKKREPMFNEDERLDMVGSLRFVFVAFISEGLGDDDCFDWVKWKKPSIWVVNRDDANVVEKLMLAAQIGTRVIFNERPGGYYSTTELVQTMRGTHANPM